MLVGRADDGLAELAGARQFEPHHAVLGHAELLVASGLYRERHDALGQPGHVETHGWRLGVGGTRRRDLSWRIGFDRSAIQLRGKRRRRSGQQRYEVRPDSWQESEIKVMRVVDRIECTVRQER